jgi:hypothetical protein
MIRDLLLETHYRGTYFFLRTVTPPDKMTAIMAIAENKKKDILVLQLYYQEEDNKRATE